MKMAEYSVEVFYKENMADVFGLEIKKSAEELGILSVESVRVSDLYRFEGKVPMRKLKRIAEDILIDPVIQEYALYGKNPPVQGRWAVEVLYREGVTDAAGDTASAAVKDSGIISPLPVHTGKKYYFRGPLTEKEVASIAEKILSNQLIQEYAICNFTQRGKK